MVTNDERDYMYLAYSADSRMRINLGIRRRLAHADGQQPAPHRTSEQPAVFISGNAGPLLRRRNRHGRQHLSRRPRTACARPCSGTADRNAGFSRATPAKLYSPVIMDPILGYEAVNVEAQQGDPSSLLSWMRNMIALRKAVPGVRPGHASNFSTRPNRKVLAYLRRDGEQQVLCVANLSRFRAARGPGPAGTRGRDTGGDARVRGLPAHRQTALPPDARAVRFLLAGVAWRSPSIPGNPGRRVGIDRRSWRTPGRACSKGQGDIGWNRCCLPEYLPKQRWFGGKARRIRCHPDRGLDRSCRIRRPRWCW